MKSIAYFYWGNYLDNGRSTLLVSGLANHLRVDFFPLTFKSVIRFLRSKSNFSFIFLDNRKAALVGVLLYPWIFNKVIILDVRELYTLRESKSFTNFFGTCIEGLMIRLATAVIVANEWRKVETIKYWRIKCPVFVYENIRFLPKNSQVLKPNFLEVNSGIKDRLEDNCRINFIMTSGFSLERNNDKLLLAFLKKRDVANLFFIGSNTKKDKIYFEKFKRDNEAENIFHLDPVNISELRGVLNFMQIGLVIYSKNNLNNKFCASGKAFEFMEAGLPILTSTNTPLLYLTEKFNAGISTDNFEYGIEETIRNLSGFKKNLEAVDFNKLILEYRNNFFHNLFEFINNS